MEKLEKQAIELLQMMCGSTGCVISDSGGKDSSVLKHITLKAHEIYGLPFSVRHNHTTVDAPETVYFVRDEKKKYESMGIKYEIHYPAQSMWQLIVAHMPYVERVTKAGNTIEIERYFTSRYKKKGISRGDKVKPTKEEQEKVNTRQAERKLRILINANYGYGDYHLVLDYIRRKGEPDRTPEQMRQDIDVFLRECRKEYRKAGLEFKYIHVMEIGKKGARHHHLVVNKIDTEILQRCWYKAYEGHNRVKVFPLDDSGNYAELASYLIKYTGTHKKGTDGALQGKRWNCSKNLVRPEPEYHIISDREYFKKEPKAIKGYYVDKNSVSMGVHSPEYYGYGYLRYTLVKITDRGG